MRVGKLFGAGALLLSLGLFAAACGDDSGSSSATTGGGSSATTASGSAAAPGAAKCNGVALGFFGALTGDNANLGVNIEQGVELAVDQFNTANPDCQVAVKKFDSQGSPDQAPALAKQAIDDASVIGIVGPAFSGESKVADPLFDEAGLPIITPSATNPALAEQRVEDLPPGARQRRLPGSRRGDLHRHDDEGLEGLRDRRRERVRQGSRRPGQLDTRLEGRRHRHDRPGRDRLLGHGHQGEGRRAGRRVLRWLLRPGWSALQAAP